MHWIGRGLGVDSKELVFELITVFLAGFTTFFSFLQKPPCARQENMVQYAHLKAGIQIVLPLLASVCGVVCCFCELYIDILIYIIKVSPDSNAEC